MSSAEKFEGGYLCEQRQGKNTPKPTTPLKCDTCQSPDKASPIAVMCETCIQEYKDHGKVLGVGTGQMTQTKKANLDLDQAFFG